MFVGHLAVALGAKQLEPKIPLAAGVAAAFGIVLLWPIFLIVGLEQVRIAPGDTAFTQLAFDSYPWSHSLLAVALWAAIVTAAGKAALGTLRSGAVLGGLVVSHWLLDFVTHRPDLPLWPDGPVAGLGLWNSVPGTIAVEGLLFVSAIAAYRSVTTARDRIGTWAFGGLIALTGVVWITQPWAPPPPSARAVAWSALIMWLLVPWAGWVERHWPDVEVVEAHFELR